MVTLIRSRIVPALQISAAAGAVSGLLEATRALMRTPWWPLDTTAIGQAMLLNGGLLALLSVPWALLAWRLPVTQFERRTWVFGLCVLLCALAGYAINRSWFPELNARSSLLFDACWLLGWGSAVWCLARVGAAHDVESVSRSRSVVVAQRLLITCVLIGGISHMPPMVWKMRHRLPAASAAAKLPNVLLVVMDTTRADRVSCYGYPRPTTPNLDQVAQEGVLFEDASAAAPWTLPSHASLFTGLYVSQHGTDRSHPRLDDELVTLPEVLREHGYQTVGFSNNPWVSRPTHFDQGFDLFEDRTVGGRASTQLAVVRVMDRLLELRPDSRDAHAAMTNRHIAGWFHAISDRPRPFFMFVNYWEPLFVSDPPEPYRHRFVSPEADRLAKSTNLYKMRRLAPPVHFDPAAQQMLSELYDGEVAYLDMRVGELLGQLRRRGLLDHTLVILTSDHGECQGEHGIFQHQFSLHQALLHVPLIMRYPARLTPGQRVQRPVELVDILPTILDVVGIKDASLPTASRGRSMFAQNEEPQVAFAEWSEASSLLPQYAKFQTITDAGYFTRSMKSFHRDRYKVIWSSDGHHELYDLQDDPQEQRNLAGERPELTTSMLAELTAYSSGLTRVGGDASTLELDQNMRSKLRALGYIQ